MIGSCDPRPPARLSPSTPTVTYGLLVTAFTLGLRHGVDWDHLAAIADLSAAAPDRRRGFVLSFLYASGHAVVVLALGVGVIAFGATLPEGVDAWAGRVVGVTLIAMGLWTVFDLARRGRNFRLQSRWMLVLGGTFAGLRRVRGAAAERTVVVDHDHPHDHVSLDDHGDPQAHDHAHTHTHAHSHVDTHVDEAVPATAGSAVAATAAASGWRRRATRLHAQARRSTRSLGHSHAHRHDLRLAGDPETQIGNGTAAGVGLLHGVGFESPTQIALFVASTSVVGTTAGLALLAVWVLGLLIANSVIAALAGFGLMSADTNFTLYASIAVIVGVVSVATGAIMVAGIDVLPALLVD